MDICTFAAVEDKCDAKLASRSVSITISVVQNSLVSINIMVMRNNYSPSLVQGTLPQAILHLGQTLMKIIGTYLVPQFYCLVW